MNKFGKIGIVIAGYILACVAAYAATYIQELATRGTDAQASQGMFAFGQSILFMLVFGGLALIPTVLAFYFLRSSEKFWNWFAVLCLAYSIMGLVVVIANALMNANGAYASSSFAVVLSLLGVLGVFGAPLLILGFLILAIIAPLRRPRLLLLASAAFEILAELYVLVNFILFQRFFSWN
jgi:hypothetical protein